MRLNARRQRPDSGEVVDVDGIGAANRKRYPMHDQWEASAYALQVIQRLAARDQIIFSDDFEPVDRMRLVKNGLIVRRSQTETKAGQFHKYGERESFEADSGRGRALCTPGPFASARRLGGCLRF